MRISSIDKYCIDLTHLANIGRIKIIYGREDVEDEILSELCRKCKGNVLLIGPSGVGKTALVENIACRIVNGSVPFMLLNWRVISLNLAALLSGSRYRGDFEERINNLVAEIVHCANCVLFIDEIHNINKMGGNDLDVSNILKPILARGDFHCIGATTYDEYHHSFESKDPALVRRFKKIQLQPFSREKTYEILKRQKQTYEDYYMVDYSDSVIRACVDLSDKYIFDRVFPDKAIDVLESTGALVASTRSRFSDKVAFAVKVRNVMRVMKIKSVLVNDYQDAIEYRDNERLASRFIDVVDKKAELITDIKIEDVVSVVSNYSGIPKEIISGDISDDLVMRIVKVLKQHVFGQDKVVELIVLSFLQKFKLVCHSVGKPIISLLLVGPAGVGKTKLCSVLSHQDVFSKKWTIIELDMCDYASNLSVFDLLGVPLSHKNGGVETFFIKELKNHPFCLILIDNFDKATEDVRKIFLQMIETGYITDSFGTKINCCYVSLIIQLTIPPDMQQQLIGFNGKVGGVSGNLDAFLNAALSTKFTNSVDKIMCMNKLTLNDIRKILKYSLHDLEQKYSMYDITVDQDVLDMIVSGSKMEQYGAHRIKKLLYDNIELLIMGAISAGELHNGAKLMFSLENGNIGLKVG